MAAPSVCRHTHYAGHCARLQIGGRTCPGGSWQRRWPVIATAIWWWLPKRQVNLLSFKIRDPKARADVEDNFRKTIGQYFGAIVQLIAGAAVLIGAWIAYNQMLLTLQVSNDQIKAAYGQIKASRDQLISQQVSKGFELLGDDKLARQLGGIYALEGVMNASEQYYQPVTLPGKADTAG